MSLNEKKQFLFNTAASGPPIVNTNSNNISKTNGLQATRATISEETKSAKLIEAKQHYEKGEKLIQINVYEFFFVLAHSCIQSIVIRFSDGLQIISLQPQNSKKHLIALMLQAIK